MVFGLFSSFLFGQNIEVFFFNLACYLPRRARFSTFGAVVECAYFNSAISPSTLIFVAQLFLQRLISLRAIPFEAYFNFPPSLTALIDIYCNYLNAIISYLNVLPFFPSQGQSQKLLDTFSEQEGTEQAKKPSHATVPLKALSEQNPCETCIFSRSIYGEICDSVLKERTKSRGARRKRLMQLLVNTHCPSGKRWKNVCYFLLLYISTIVYSS